MIFRPQQQDGRGETPMPMKNTTYTRLFRTTETHYRAKKSMETVKRTNGNATDAVWRSNGKHLLAERPPCAARRRRPCMEIRMAPRRTAGAAGS